MISGKFILTLCLIGLNWCASEKAPKHHSVQHKSHFLSDEQKLGKQKEQVRNTTDKSPELHIEKHRLTRNFTSNSQRSRLDKLLHLLSPELRTETKVNQKQKHHINRKNSSDDKFPQFKSIRRLSGAIPKSLKKHSKQNQDGRRELIFGLSEIHIILGQPAESLTETQPETSQFQPQALPTKPETGTFQPESAQFQPESALFQPESAPYQPESAQYQPESAQYQPESAPYQPESAPYQPESAPYQPESAPFQPESAPFQPISAPFQPESAYQTAEKPPIISTPPPSQAPIHVEEPIQETPTDMYRSSEAQEVQVEVPQPSSYPDEKTFTICHRTNIRNFTVACLICHDCTNTNNYCIAADCYAQRCADFSYMPGNGLDACCPRCPNGHNCLVEGEILPMGQVVKFDNGTECGCIYGRNERVQTKCTSVVNDSLFEYFHGPSFIQSPFL